MTGSAAADAMRLKSCTIYNCTEFWKSTLPCVCCVRSGVQVLWLRTCAEITVCLSTRRFWGELHQWMHVIKRWLGALPPMRRDLSLAHCTFVQNSGNWLSTCLLCLFDPGLRHYLWLAYRTVASTNTCYYSENQIFCFLKSWILTCRI